MATGNHVGNDAEVHRLKQAKALDHFNHKSTPADEENMREVSSHRPEIQLKIRLRSQGLFGDCQKCISRP